MPRPEAIKGAPDGKNTSQKRPLSLLVTNRFATEVGQHSCDNQSLIVWHFDNKMHDFSFFRCLKEFIANYLLLGPALPDR